MNQNAQRLLQTPSGAGDGLAAATYLANGAKLSLFLGQLQLDAAATRLGEIQIVDPETDEWLAMGVIATEIRDARGQVTAVVSVLHDLTRLRELEQRRVQQHWRQHELHHATCCARQRSYAGSGYRRRAELAEAKRRLEEEQSNRAEFIRTIAHDLTQPLTAIIGCAQLLGRPTLSEEARERTRATLLSQTRRMMRLVRDLSDAALLASGSFRITPVEADLIDLVGEQVELARMDARGHTIDIDAPVDSISGIWSGCYLHPDPSAELGGSGWR
jgi:signal transduction histidine kinase